MSAPSDQIADPRMLDTYGLVVGSGHDGGAGGTNRQGVGIVNQNGGVVTFENTNSSLARNGAKGTYNLNAGAANFQDLYLGFNRATAFDEAGNPTAWQNGQHTDGQAIFNLNGGTLTVRKIEVQTSNNALMDSVFNLNGGTLKARNDATGVWITDQIDEFNVLAGGGVIDTNGRNVEIAANLSGTGTLTIQGGGNLKLTGDNVAFRGAVNVTEGAVTLASNAVLSLVLDGSQGIEGGVADATNPLTMTGGGSLVLEDGVTLNVVLNNTGALAEGTYVYNIFVGNVSYDKDQVNLVTGVAGGYSYTLNGNGTLTVQVVPEPGTYALLGGVGLLGLVALRRRKTKA